MIWGSEQHETDSTVGTLNLSGLWSSLPKASCEYITAVQIGNSTFQLAFQLCPVAKFKNCKEQIIKKAFKLLLNGHLGIKYD